MDANPKNTLTHQEESLVSFSCILTTCLIFFASIVSVTFSRILAAYHSFQIGMDVLLYAWTGAETPVAKATVLSVDPDTIVGGEPL